ncbi:MAG: glycosyltransferase [Candidatus Bathyarchaeia archaeon]
MHIFYVNVIEENAGWGAEWFMNEAFVGLGHTTYCVDYRKHRFGLYEYFVRAPPSDFFFLQRGDYFPLSLVRAVAIPRFYWATELVSRRRDQDQLLKSRLFDHIFLHTRECRDAVVSRGWVDPSKCSVLLNAFDERIYKPVPGVQKDIDILLTGNMTPRRLEFLRDLRREFNVVAPERFVPIGDLVVMMNRAKIVLNIHADNYPDTETRVYETLGCGTFLLSERLSVDNPFGNEIIQFDTYEGLASQARYFLEHEDEREAIARRCHELALQNHTYMRRTQEVLETMSKYLDRAGLPKQPVVKDWRLKVYRLSQPVRHLGWLTLRKARISAAKLLRPM